MLSVFAAGMTTLAIEISASRLLGNVFGTSNLVWANVIGLILIYLTVGYFIGGKWADRSPHFSTFYRIVAWGAFTSGLIPIVSKPVLRQAAFAVVDLDAIVMVGSFISVLILFTIPVTLLGTVSPFAIRLALTDAAEAGSISGRIYATSTLGSILGTFVPVLWLIPTIGTSRTFWVYSFLLLAVGLVGIARSSGLRSLLRFAWMPVVLLLLAILSISSPIKSFAASIYEGESAYNYIQVQEIEGIRILYLNEGLGEHSIYYASSEKPPYDYGPWDYFLAAPFFNESPTAFRELQRVGLIGLAGGTIAKQFTQVYGPVPIDGWEIDPVIVEVGQRYFDMTEPNLTPIVADGRVGLAHSQEKYSVIGIDAYRAPYIPWHLTTREFFSEVLEKLDDEGVLVINVARTPEDKRLVEAIVGTISDVFPSVYVVEPSAIFNSIVFATRNPTGAQNLVKNVLALDAARDSPRLFEIVERTIDNLVDTPQSSIVFTDDRAPVEQLVNSIVIRYIIGGLDQFQN
jgi:predicted membrane-bound spermidine synthase